MRLDRYFANRHYAYMREMLKNHHISHRVRPDWEMVEAVLSAVGQIGGEAEVKRVREVIDMNARSAKQKSIQESALDCLLLLKSRIESEKPGMTLLRTASTPLQDDRLLRPAFGKSEIDQNLLLHPASIFSSELSH